MTINNVRAYGILTWSLHFVIDKSEAKGVKIWTLQSFCFLQGTLSFMISTG